MWGISRDLVRQIQIMMRPVAARVLNSIGRGVVTLVNDSESMQRIQILANLDEVLEGLGGAEHFQPYGFFSVPLPGAQVAYICPNGDRAHPIAVVVADPRYRPTDGQPGEAGLATDEGDEIRLARGHEIVFDTSGKVRLGSPAAAGDVVVQAALTDFVAALTVAITASAGNAPGAAALAALKTALQALNGSQGWTARTTKAKAE